MSEIEKVLQKQEVQIVEKFREILDEVPKQCVWLDASGEYIGRYEDTVLVFYDEEDKEPKVEALQVEERLFTHVGFSKFDDARPPRGANTTTGEQLRDIVAKKGSPSRILYIRSGAGSSGYSGKDNDSFYGIFPFSEISEELGL
jgi:hypothetical protein